MPPLQNLGLPYLTREMLAFENGVSFKLRVDLQSDTAATLALRGMTREATFEYKAVAAATSDITSTEFPLSDIPIYVTIEDTARALSQGACFCAISLLANGVVIQQLTSGYIYSQKALSWPNTQQVELRPGGGRLQRKIPATPAAGADIELIVPAGEIWRVQDITFLLTTSSTVANRRVHVTIETAHDVTVETWSNTDQTASTTRVYHVANYGVIQSETSGSDILIALPNPFLLLPTDGILIEAVNMRAGDQFTPDEITIEKYFTTP